MPVEIGRRTLGALTILLIVSYATIVDDIFAQAIAERVARIVARSQATPTA